MLSITVDDNILLRSYEDSDAPALFAAVDGARAHLRPWLVWVDMTTKVEHSLQFIRHSNQQMNAQEGMALGIFWNGRVIGGIGLHQWEKAINRTQIGYWIIKDYEGQGIVSKCVKAFVRFLFDRAGVNKIEVHFEPGNQRSAWIAQSLGCKTEGIIRQSVLRNGQPADIVIAGLLKSEWMVRHTSG